MSPRKSEGCFVVRNNGRLEYRFFYIDEYGQKKRTLILTNYNLQIDVGYSVNFVSKVKTFADENGLVVKYEELKHAAYERRMERKEKMKFFFNLPPVNALHDTLEQYRSNIEEKLHAIDK